MVDLNAYIKDEKLFIEIQKREKIRKRLMNKDGEDIDDDEGIEVNPSF